MFEIKKKLFLPFDTSGLLVLFDPLGEGVLVGLPFCSFLLFTSLLASCTARASLSSETFDRFREDCPGAWETKPWEMGWGWSACLPARSITIAFGLWYLH